MKLIVAFFAHNLESFSAFERSLIEQRNISSNFPSSGAVSISANSAFGNEDFMAASVAELTERHVTDAGGLALRSSPVS